MTWTRSTNAGYDAAGTTQGRYLGRVKQRAEESEDRFGEDVLNEGNLKRLSRCCPYRSLLLLSAPSNIPGALLDSHYSVARGF